MRRTDKSIMALCRAALRAVGHLARGVASRWAGRRIRTRTAREAGPAPRRPRAATFPAERPPRRTVGHSICIAMTGALLGCAGMALILSCCWQPPATAPAGLAAFDPPRLAAEQARGRPSLAQAAQRVHLRLARGAGRLLVSCAAGGRWNGLSPAGWQRAGAQRTWQVGAAGGVLTVAGEAVPGGAALFVPDDGVFRLDGHSHRGSLLVKLDGAGALTAMGIILLEDYVRGVVPAEMSPDWPRQALMAQAVAARTFALYRMTAPGATRSYLTLADTAYRGAEAETAPTDEAVRATAGVILWYDGAPLPAYFHSSCGGHTSSVAAVFGEREIPPLRGVPCGWCTRSPQYSWSALIERSEIARRLSSWGIGHVESLRAIQSDSAGRPVLLLVNGTKQVRANDFRLAAGPDRIKSTAFAVVRRGSAFEFVGRGWGHGVGMCQWGARGMALAGKSCWEILAHYYPGARPGAIPRP